MRRRSFIGLWVAGIGGIAAGGYVFFEKFENVARKILIKDTSSLLVPLEEIDKYLLASRRKRNIVSRLPFGNQQLLKWHYYLDNSWFSLPYKTKNSIDRSKIVGDFLLSTDFFTNKMDITKPVAFVKIYDPYESPCSNPFSNLYYPET